MCAGAVADCPPVGVGWCMAALPLYFKLEESISMLVKGGKMVVEIGVDYR